tara:strand:- start:508 stop:990 length:483 start_codon:yes stop_codon:yes gene_type:complete
MPTKPELESDLKTANSLVETLQQQVKDAVNVGNTLTGTIWLPRTADETFVIKGSGEEADKVIKKITWSQTSKGTPAVKFDAQLSSWDKLKSETIYGPTWSFVATDNGCGDLATRVREFIEADTRLVNFKAFPRFYKTKEGAPAFDFMITSLEVRPRKEAS